MTPVPISPQFPIQHEPVTPVQLLTPDGALTVDRSPLTDDEVLAALRDMMLARTFDARALSLQRQGKFGTFSQVTGQEATLVGAACVLDRSTDWIVPQYRELPALLRHGLPLKNFVLTFTGHPVGGRVPEGVNVLPIQISLAAQLPHAVGLAWGLRHQGGGGVVVAFVGDGASSEGDFHESVNLAGVLGAPVIFVLSDNGWAISTPRCRQSAAANFASRGPGYGVPGVVVDGNDLMGVAAVVGDAVTRARRGDGPTLVESITYRIGAHNTADDPTRYRTVDEVEEWSHRDPLVRLQRYLSDRGVWTDELADQWQSELDSQITEALAAAAAVQRPGVCELFDHVTARPWPRLQGQRRVLEGRLHHD